jgi:hypothetical protein
MFLDDKDTKNEVHEKRNVYEVFFLFLFFISKTHDMRWKNLNLFFDENATISFLKWSALTNYWSQQENMKNI